MSYAQRIAISIATDGSGNGFAATAPLFGRVVTVRFVASAAWDSAARVTVLKNAPEPAVILDIGPFPLSEGTYAPRVATHSVAGVASTYDGTRPVNRYVELAGHEVEIEIEGGGADETAVAYLILA